MKVLIDGKVVELKGKEEADFLKDQQTITEDLQKAMQPSEQIRQQSKDLSLLSLLKRITDLETSVSDLQERLKNVK